MDSLDPASHPKDVQKLPPRSLSVGVTYKTVL